MNDIDTGILGSAGYAVQRDVTLHVSIDEQMIEFNRITSVGRNGDIRIFKDVPWVSRHHLELLVNQEENWIRDANSKAGTYVNGEPISSEIWLKLKDTDEITIGGLLPVNLIRTTALMLLRRG